MTYSLMAFMQAAKQRQAQGFSLESAVTDKPEDDATVEALKVIDQGQIAHPAYSDSDLLDWAMCVCADTEGAHLTIDPTLLTIGQWMVTAGIANFPSPRPLLLRLAYVEALVAADRAARTYRAMMENQIAQPWV